jgi:hypothetical protein
MFKESPHPIFRPFSVERKETKSRRPGVVIVTCKTKANRDEILSAKKKMQLSRQWIDVSLQQRIESENMCIFVKALGYVNPDLSVGGGK